MNPFLKSLIALLLNVLFGGLSWQEAIQRWLDEQSAVLGSREAVEEKLQAMAKTVGMNLDADIDAEGAVCCSADPGKFGDGRIWEFFKTIDWAKFAQFIMTIIAVIPK